MIVTVFSVFLKQGRCSYVIWVCHSQQFQPYSLNQTLIPTVAQQYCVCKQDYMVLVDKCPEPTQASGVQSETQRKTSILKSCMIYGSCDWIELMWLISPENITAAFQQTEQQQKLYKANY